MSELFKGLERIEEARERLAVRVSWPASMMAGLTLPCCFRPKNLRKNAQPGEAYCDTIRSFLIAHVDPDEIERTAKIPDYVLKGLFQLGAFGMKIPTEYGGLGFSYRNYGRVLTLIASWSNILALTVAVPQSIGIAMPILLFGSEEQKRHYLPRVAPRRHVCLCAHGTDDGFRCRPYSNARLSSIPTGDAFVINGDKLWCTNGPIARFVTLIARVPAKRVQRDGKSAWVPVRPGEVAEDQCLRLLFSTCLRRVYRSDSDANSKAVAGSKMLI